MILYMRKEDAVNSVIIGIFVACLILILRATLNIPQLSRILYLPAVLLLLPLLSVGGMFIAGALGKKLRVLAQGARFLLVGGSNTLVDITILNVLTAATQQYAGVWFPMFKGISFLVAVVNSYFWNKYWTFAEQKNGKQNTNQALGQKGKEFAQFVVVSGIGFLLNVATATVVVNVIGPQFDISEKAWGTMGALAGTLVVLTWNFLGYKFIVFRK